MIKPSTTRALSGLLALGVVASALDVAVLAPSAQSRTWPARSRTKPAVELRLRESPGRVDVVIAGLGTEVRAVSRSQSDGRWSARLTGVDLGDRPFTPQQQLLSSSELLSVRLEPLDGDLRLIVKARMGERVPTPTIGSDGEALVVSFAGLTGPEMRSSGRLDLSRPGRVAQSVIAPPMRPRAVAPPLGDMAIGTMVLKNRSYIQATGPSVSLTLNNSPAKDALMSLARLGGYGFVYVGESNTNDDQVNPVGVTMAFRDERYDRALNSLLLASGLQAKLDGRTLMVGTSVASKTFAPQISKVIRLNQVSARAAAEYLGNLGATFNLTNTITTNSGGNASAGGSNSSPLETSTSLYSESFGASAGPLRGLVVTTDSRLQSLTMVGESQLVAVAESYLKQVDLRQRQVALSVRILDIQLDNDDQMSNSFAFRSGNAFIVSDNGSLLANFGAYKPPGTTEGGLPGRYTAQESTMPTPGTGVLDGGEVFLDRPTSAYPMPGSKTEVKDTGVMRGPYRPDFGTYDNPMQPGISEIDDKGVATYQAPTRFQYPENQLFDFLTAQIESSSTKLLASPTLIIQEGEGQMSGSDGSPIGSDGKIGREQVNEALVSVGERLVSSFSIREGENGSIFCEPELTNAGLTLGARVDKIDDNGFVTFSLSPQVSAAVRVDFVERCGNINIINSRSLDTGKIRVRDGQTLILTGVISDSDIEAVTKWPILGDIPFIGQFFRSSRGSRTKRELVILVTPRIIDDSQGGTFGYGYKPTLPAARQIMSDY